MNGLKDIKCIAYIHDSRRRHMLLQIIVDVDIHELEVLYCTITVLHDNMIKIQ